MSSTPTKSLIVGTRSSKLAVVQTGEAIERLAMCWPDTTFTTRTHTSPGDRDLVTPLTEAGIADDFFTRDLDEAVLNGEVDLAIHSAKDLPQTLRDGLCVAALFPARDIRDALVVRDGVDLDKPGLIIGTSSPKREAAVQGLHPNAACRSIRGTIEQRLAQLDQGDYDAVIIAACALERLELAKRIHSYLPYEPTPQQGRLAVVIRSDRDDLLAPLRACDVRRTAGLVAIVGCPASAEYLSERARSYLRQADVVIHDRLLPDEILLHIRDKAVAVGKSGGDASTPQPHIHQHILHEAEQGKLVVRLKGGDPLIFAHLAEELAFLQAWHLRADIVPTLTAAQIAAAQAGAPLTHRQDGGHLHLVSGHTPKGESPAAYPAPGTGNVAIYMGVNEAGDTKAQLAQAGWPMSTPVLIGERLGYRDEAVRSVSLDEMDQIAIQRPAVFLLGVKPFGLTSRTLFVGTDPERFLNYGPLIHWPLITLTSIPLQDRAQLLAEHWDACDGVFFPSRFAVTSFMEALLAERDVRAMAGKRCLAVGPATADALLEYGLRADAAVDHYGGIRALCAETDKTWSGTYLYPCSSEAPQAERLATLREIGIEAQPHVFYKNRHVAYRQLPATSFDRVLFTSASTVKAYFESYPDELSAHRTWLAVGPSTGEMLIHHGLRPDYIKRNS